MLLQGSKFDEMRYGNNTMDAMMSSMTYNNNNGDIMDSWNNIQLGKLIDKAKDKEKMVSSCPTSYYLRLLSKFDRHQSQVLIDERKHQPTTTPAMHLLLVAKLT